MFEFIKKMFIMAMTFVGCGALKCVSMIDQECKVRPAMINIISNEPLFYRCSILVKKNAVVTAIILIICMLNYVFLKFLNTSISKYLI